MWNKQNATSLKLHQLSAVHRLLALNTEPPPEDSTAATGKFSTAGTRRYYPAGSAHNQWKILIYDAHCRAIISPLMNVSDLRSRGVTLHLLLASDREPIPDVPAVYFVQPTRENVQILARDCAAGLYSRMYINFVTKLPRPLMEEFARLVVQSGSTSLERVASVHDQYLDYVCYERGLFSLNVPDSYALYNNPRSSEAQIEQAMQDIANGLFSVVATMGVVPVIRCPRNGAPEMVCRKLNQLIMEHPTLMSSTRQKGSATSSSRPIVVLFDRNEDLVTPIQHTSTYQALVDDVLQHKANRVEFTVEDKAGADDSGKPVRRKPPQTKKYDLDADEDPFYFKHKFNAFPEAIESNGLELQRVSDKEAEVRSKTTAQQQQQAMASAVVVTEDPNTDHLSTAVASLPQLLEQKKQLEIHTSILQAVMNQVAARDIPTLYELESSLATGAYKNDLPRAKKEVMELLQDKTKTKPECLGDKIRLTSVYCLATKCPSSAVDACIQALREAHPNQTSQAELEAGVGAIEYLKQLRSMQTFDLSSDAMQEDAPSSAGLGGSTANANGDMLASFMARAQTQATGLLAKATERVGTIMLGKLHKHHMTRAVEHLCEQRPNTEDDTYLYLDPKVKGEISVTQLRAQGVARAPVRDVVAFVIGGGCYAEYQNLQMISNSGSGESRQRNITYGSTELVNPSVFLTQLSQLK